MVTKIKTVLILTETDIEYDNRVKKQLLLCKQRGHKALTIEIKNVLKPSFSMKLSKILAILDKDGINKIKNILKENSASMPILNHKIEFPFKHLEKFIHDGIATIQNIKPDFIIANDLIAGVIAMTYNKLYATPYWYDSHELQVFRNYKNSWLRALTTYHYEKQVMKNAKKVSTVSSPIKLYYENLYNRKVEVYENNFFQNKSINKLSYESQKDNVLVYFGHINKGRGIKYWDKIAQTINAKKILIFSSSDSRNHTRIIKHVKTPVKFMKPFTNIDNELVRVLQPYNVYGLCLIEPVCLSYKNALPNKFFEYKTLGILPIVIKKTYLETVVQKDKRGAIFDTTSSHLSTKYCSIYNISG